MVIPYFLSDADEIEVTDDVANAEFPLTSAKLENQDLTQYEDIAKTSNGMPFKNYFSVNNIFKAFFTICA